MFLRRNALEKSGLLDEDFFMYGEDIDLSYRILKSGYKNYFLPSPILHYKGESTNKSSYRYTHTFYQAMQLFFKKNFSPYSILVSLPISFAIWGRAIFAYLGNLFRHRKVLKRVQLNCIVVGRTEAINGMRALLDRIYSGGKHLFMEGDEASLPAGHLAADIDFDKYNTVVYDTEAYSYEAILKLLQKSSSKGLRLGTYSVGTKKFITDSAVHETDK